ncbi:MULTISPECIES: hypothetical protein [Arthrobacter]|uniref:Uncharacterized protein n=1 Tax=Arthrobacter terricola TaxID=2547396 RepID=A0A4V6PIC4_9MICC|nr:MULTISPECIES: hypothetical protein [Arthrobacter]MBT8162948.1 hypothetical protein [Arthrobacter sp. GN70]TDF91644.1 hypothetical protein E1809_20195 [Arthrobacter terricola]
MRLRRIIGILVILWLLIGAAAAVQRGQFSTPPASCSQAGTIAVTIVSGPLNYLGVNPKIGCQIPSPSP